MISWVWVFTIVLAVGIMVGFAVSYNPVVQDGQPSRTFEKSGFVVKEFDKFLSHAECDSLMAFCESQKMEQSSVLSYGAKSDIAVKMDSRESKTKWLQNDQHPVANKMADFAAELSGKPVGNQEMLQVVKYDDGGKFNPHFDACDIEEPEYKKRVNHGAGQRLATLLVYLNDTYEGGETDFVEIGYKVKPQKGKAVFFWDTDDKEEILPLSRHMGCEVRGGNKWIATKWVHPTRWD
jgi:prolyl 4-hydroxylase